VPATLALDPSHLTLVEYGDQLASSAPVPGGGSAAAVVGGFAAALIAMVARLSVDRPRYAEHAAVHTRALADAEAARGRFLELAEQDATAYAGYAAAIKLPRTTDADQAGRQRAMREAAREAALAPLEIVRLCRSLVDEVEALAGRSNVNAASDLEVAGQLLGAAAAGAAANVRINLPGLGDPAEADRIGREVDALEQGVRDVVVQIQAALRDGPRNGSAGV
jgi:methenyltetrahydrofolate cyclohydrolase